MLLCLLLFLDTSLGTSLVKLIVPTADKEKDGDSLLSFVKSRLLLFLSSDLVSEV
jgi:hypothetical protein